MQRAGGATQVCGGLSETSRLVAAPHLCEGAPRAAGYLPDARGGGSTTDESEDLGDNEIVKDRVLIVDDHASFRRSARLLLEADGYKVIGEARDGRSALSEAESLVPDVVLLDVFLPDMDGFEVASELTGRGLAVVVLTSSRDGRDFGSLVVESGARGFIPKPELSGASLAAVVGA